MPVKCNLCDKVFSKKGNANRHYRETHNEEIEDNYKRREWSYQCLEENCDIMFPQVKALINHLENIHQLTFETVNLSLENLEEFSQWKSAIEHSYNCQYIIKNRFKNSDEKETLYLTCNRSKASYTLKTTELRKQSLKNDSLKLHYSCTSGMKVLVNDDSVEVEWQKYHYGHDLDIQHIPKQTFNSETLRNRGLMRRRRNVDDKNRSRTISTTIESNDHNYAYHECPESEENGQIDENEELYNVEMLENEENTNDDNDIIDDNRRNSVSDESSGENTASTNENDNLEKRLEIDQELSEHGALDAYPINFKDAFSDDKNPIHIEFYDTDEIIDGNDSDDENLEEYFINTEQEVSDAESRETTREILKENQTNSVNTFSDNDSINTDEELWGSEYSEENQITNSESSEIEYEEVNRNDRSTREHQIIIHVLDEKCSKRSHITNYLESDLENPTKRHKYWVESQIALQLYKKDNKDLHTTNTHMQETIRRLQAIANELKMKR